MREGWLTADSATRMRPSTALWDFALGDMPPRSTATRPGEGALRQGCAAGRRKEAARRALVYFGANSGPGVSAPRLYGRDRRGSPGVAPAGARDRGAGSPSSIRGERCRPLTAVHLQKLGADSGPHKGAAPRGEDLLCGGANAGEGRGFPFGGAGSRENCKDLWFIHQPYSTKGKYVAVTASEPRRAR